MTIERARRGAADPLRRALGRAGPDAPPARRARAARRRADRAGDRDRVPHGGARPRRARRRRHAVRAGRRSTRAASARRLHRVSLDPPLYDTFAFVTRRDAHLSPATRAFMELAEERITRIGRRLEREAGAVRRTPAPPARRYDHRHGPGPRDRRRRGVPADDHLAGGGRPAADRSERRTGHAALRPDRARDDRPARARRLHHARRGQGAARSPTRAASTRRASSAATG